MLYRFGVLIVILHLLVVIPHAIAHTMMHIDVSTWQNFYIVLVILIAPVASGVLLWRRSRFGFVPLSLSMAGAFVFGFYYHFIAAGSDNALFLHPHAWARTFQISAALLAVVELIGVVVGLLGIKVGQA